VLVVEDENDDDDGFIAPEFEEPVCACFFVWV